jgi:intracellular multiplication protein IcmK
MYRIKRAFSQAVAFLVSRWGRRLGAATILFGLIGLGLWHGLGLGVVDEPGAGDLEIMDAFLIEDPAAPEKVPALMPVQEVPVEWGGSLHQSGSGGALLVPADESVTEKPGPMSEDKKVEEPMAGAELVEPQLEAKPPGGTEEGSADGGIDEAKAGGVFESHADGQTTDGSEVALEGGEMSLTEGDEKGLSDGGEVSLSEGGGGRQEEGGEGAKGDKTSGDSESLVPEADREGDGGRKEAYERSLKILLPTTPEEVRGYRMKLDEREEAMSDSRPAAMRSRTERVRLEPGREAPLVELSPNLVTALVFTDSTGSPWPVAATVLGSGSLFSAQLLENGAANQVVVSPLSNHGHSNLVVSLKGNDIPLVVRLITSSAVDPARQLDGLIIFQIQEPGPGARPLVNGSVKPRQVVDALLYSLLDGVEPTRARAVIAEPALEGESFVQVGSNLYLRTTRALIWPAPQARVSGPGGLSVYELPPVPSVLLADRDEVFTVLLSGVEVERPGVMEVRP